MRTKPRAITVSALIVLVLTGCSGPVRKHAVPQTLTTRAVVPGLADVRYRLGIDTERLRADALESF